jgi:OOP family OmpA-OmpF porin
MMQQAQSLKKAFVGALALVAASGMATASAIESGPYIGGGLGVNDYRQAGKSDFGPGGQLSDDDSLAWRVFGGYRLENFALEAGYNDFGKLKGRNVAGGVKADAWGIDLSGLAFVPVNDRFEVFGRAGTYYWNSDVKGAGQSAARLKDKTAWDFTYGVGGQVKATADVAVRGEWRQFRDLYGRVNNNVWMASLVGQF